MNEGKNAEINVFINFSNHPSNNWSENQKKAVFDQYNARIVDIAFPSVSAFADENEISILAKECFETICNYDPEAVMCQGEFGLTYQVVTLLKQKDILTVYSCSERKTIEKKTDNGTVKTSEFCFVRFREY